MKSTRVATVFCMVILSIVYLQTQLFGFGKSNTNEPTVQKTYLDTLNKGQEISLIENKPVKQTKTEAPKKAPAYQQETAEGYRIQLSASTSLDNIKAKKRSLQNEVRLKMYITFNKPYYKLYAGNFLEKGEAKRALGKIKKLGFRDAWIVKSQIVIE